MENINAKPYPALRGKEVSSACPKGKLESKFFSSPESLTLLKFC